LGHVIVNLIGLDLLLVNKSDFFIVEKKKYTEESCTLHRGNLRDKYMVYQSLNVIGI
jgi:hypothetical protein